MPQPGVKLPGLDFQFHCWFLGWVTSQSGNEKNILQIFAHVGHHGYIILPCVYASKPQAYQWYIWLACSPQILLHKHRHRPKWLCEHRNIVVLEFLTYIYCFMILVTTLSTNQDNGLYPCYLLYGLKKLKDSTIHLGFLFKLKCT